MGMDVYGREPDDEAGRYFRNNIWWWKPLADYITGNHADIAERCAYWYTNDGDGLDRESSLELARRLRGDLADGRVETYQRERQQRVDSLAPVACTLCGSSGVRSDDVGILHSMVSRELHETAQRVTGRTHGWCNGCDGLGWVSAWETRYQFSPANVAEFAAFLEHCGGFRIL